MDPQRKMKVIPRSGGQAKARPSGKVGPAAPVIQALLEEPKPQRRPTGRLAAQKRRKAAEDRQPPRPRPEAQPGETPALGRLPRPPLPPPAQRLNLDKNFVRMLKGKEARVRVDAENAEMVALKLARQKRDDLEDVTADKKAQFKCEEGWRWQEKVLRHRRRRTASIAAFWDEQNEMNRLINGQEFGKRRRNERGGAAPAGVGRGPATAGRTVYQQLADIKVRRAACRAMLEEKQHKEAVAARRRAEEAAKERDERRRVAAVEEFRDYNHKAVREKELRERATRELEKEERIHKTKALDEEDDVQKRLLGRHRRGARDIQDGYADVCDQDFAYKKSRRRILCNAPTVRDDGPPRAAEWPYLTVQGNYMATTTGAPLRHKGAPQSRGGPPRKGP